MNLVEAMKELGIKKWKYQFDTYVRENPWRGLRGFTFDDIFTTAKVGRRIEGYCTLLRASRGEVLSLVVTSYEKEREIVFEIGDPWRMRGWVCWYSTVLNRGEFIDQIILCTPKGQYILMRAWNMPDNARFED